MVRKSVPTASSDQFWRKLFGPKAYLICRVCGWRSEPFPPTTMFAGPGGQIGCPECAKLKRHWNLEVYGDVERVIE